MEQRALVSKYKHGWSQVKKEIVASLIKEMAFNRAEWKERIHVADSHTLDKDFVIVYLYLRLHIPTSKCACHACETMFLY